MDTECPRLRSHTASPTTAEAGPAAHPSQRLAAPGLSISTATQLSSGGKELGMWPRPEREKGPLCAPAKTQFLSPNWAASPLISSTLLVAALQTPSLNPEQKLLSGLIYNPDLLMGPKAFLPCRAAAGLKQPPSPRAALRLCPLLLARRWHLSGCWPLSTSQFGGPAGNITQLLLGAAVGGDWPF